MSNVAPHTPGDAEASVHEEYPLDVRVLTVETDDGPRYRFEAPDHVGQTFADPEKATLYADVYFDTNGFVEAGTGDRGIPPELVVAGKDTLAAYLLTRPGATPTTVASFYGTTPGEIERFVSWVRDRAAEIRANLDDHGPA